MDNNKQEGDKVLEESFNGLLIVRARNGNFNAGFDGNPRTLPDGTIFATDKALKYCIREYLTTFKTEPIFVRRNRYMKKFGKKENEKILYAYDTLEENYNNKFDEWRRKLFPNINENNIWEDENIMKILKSFLDVRLFGVVFSPKGKKKNISLTGATQISYGVNKLGVSSSYSSQILSPYRNEKEAEEVTNTTIGEETRADEVYYVYNISVNHANAKRTEMTYGDLDKLKDALINSVDPITSCTKYGGESVALIWLSNHDNFVLNNLDEFIKIEKDKDGKVKLKIDELKAFLKNYNFDGINSQEFNLTDFDLSEKEENKNKIQIIYKKGKIIVEE